jgi:UDP-N-acetylmuramate dehydrogenase
VDRAAFERDVEVRVGPGRLQPNAPLAELTTFRVGGPADWLIDVRSSGELEAVLVSARTAGVPITLLGGGSNVIIADAGVRGVVIRLRLSSIEQVAQDRVRAEAGLTINGLVRWTISHGLAGLEAWAGTPGTVGGAIYGNAHFAGRNVSDLVARVQLITNGGEREILAAEEMEFAYDTSRLRRTHEVLVWAEFKVGPGKIDLLRQTARESLAYRKRTQPLALPSAGCVFQNPDPAVDRLPAGMPASAGALVDRAGLKGHRVGGARISSTHANFVVNEGTATARDIRDTVEAARSAVQAKFGVVLKDEVVYLGDFGN